jgi:hypothetical protein
LTQIGAIFGDRTTVPVYSPPHDLNSRLPEG